MLEVVISRTGNRGRVVRLGGGVYGMGRAEENEIILDDPEVSRKHARLIVEGDRALVEDLGSGNGTYVDGQPVQELSVSGGDSVEIVPFTLSFRVVDQDSRAEVRLEVIAGSLKGQSFPLTTGRVSMGRSEDQDLRIPDPGASRGHALLTQEGRGWILRDQGSANGLFLNEQRLREAPLRNGDVIRIGATQLRFVMVEPPRSEPPPPPAVIAADPVMPAAPARASGSVFPVVVVVGGVVVGTILWVLMSGGVAF